MATATGQIGQGTTRPAASAVRKLQLAAGLLVLGIVAAVLALSVRSNPAGSIVPASNPAIEAKWGVRPTQIATTADGGLVDFRFVVLDADKALALVQDVSNLPVLQVEGNGKIINSAASMAAKHDLAAGRTYFLIYRDDAGAIRPGSRVSIVFGDKLRIEHVVAR